jgi:hypothetical protein
MANPVKAELRELDPKFENEINADHNTVVQFNPETVKVSFSNQIVQPSGGGDQRGKAAQLFVGAGATKLSCQLVFDVTQEAPAGQGAKDDVRQLTERVAYFITPRGDEGSKVPPAVRFLWGSFQFDGIVDSLEESLEFFSPDGRPLRATLSLSMSQQKITKYAFRATGGGGAPRSPGASPLTPAPAGATLQSMTASQGGGSWQGVAAGNGIENPRRLQPGQMIDMNRRGK